MNALGLFFGFLALAGAAWAGPLERLVSPGPLAQAHALYETRCELCHARFDKSAQRALCLDCHKAVRTDLEKGEGFHGRMRGIATSPCRTCHPDHLGRNADIVGLDRGVFDHGHTDFTLTGSHAGAPCASCHREGTRFREAPRVCAACHTRDPHQGRLGERCETCHDTARWAPASVDHQKTRYPLAGRHQKVACALCHLDRTFAKEAPTDCLGCHGVDDKHDGRYGNRCEQCHTVNGWKRITTDHDRTRYPLKGAHTKVACDRCHPGNRFKGIPTDCRACHGAADPHRGAFGARCADCHTSDTWTSARFDHAATRFALAGAHRRVDCQRCHTGPLAAPRQGWTCSGCHANSDVHGGLWGPACSRCHIPEGWSAATFSHGRTSYPLEGAHEKVPCLGCHREPVGEKKLGSACVGCHRADDVHAGIYGEKCEACHPRPQRWGTYVFDHQKTSFPLVESHQRERCSACHVERVVTGATPRVCADCHAQDDPHRGEQGPACAGCHGQTDWVQGVAFDHELTGFPLVGQHAAAPCEACHPTREYRGTKTDCTACHAAKDVHTGTLGTGCSLCHTPNDWRIWQFDHDTQTKARLEGAHRRLACKSCHTQRADPKVTAPKDCVGCHAKDDVHRGGYGRRCERCHGVVSFRDLEMRW